MQCIYYDKYPTQDYDQIKFTPRCTCTVFIYSTNLLMTKVIECIIFGIISAYDVSNFACFSYCPSFAYVSS